MNSMSTALTPSPLPQAGEGEHGAIIWSAMLKSGLSLLRYVSSSHDGKTPAYSPSPSGRGEGVREKASPVPRLVCLLFILLPACKIPDINLATPKPIEVNLNMRLDVYQYSGDEPKDQEQQKTLAETVERQRNRATEIQTIKNNRFIGEDHRGLLQLREVPAGEWGDYVKRVVEAENEDRTLLMRSEAAKTNRALNEVQTEQWKLRIDKAFKGEWIEVPGDKEGSYKWVQATGPKPKEG